MHKKDMVDAMLGKIEQAIIRILNNSQSIDSYHYYLITPAGKARVKIYVDGFDEPFVKELTIL